MSSTVDANILDYASDTADPLHARAEALVRRLAAVRIVYTRDRGFRRFDGIDPRDPFA